MDSFCGVVKDILDDIKDGKLEVELLEGVDLSPSDCTTLLENDKKMDLLREQITSVYYQSYIQSEDISQLENVINFVDWNNTGKFNPLGIPLKPYFYEISNAIISWAQTNECPIKFNTMNLLNETENDLQRLQQLSPHIIETISNWGLYDPHHRRISVLNILKGLGKKGILTLLKIRRTQGSVVQLPPSFGDLIRACNEPHAPGSPSKLTVAGRALSKHAQRSLEGMWGDPHGPEIVKNLRAEKIILSILMNATWINIHSLPHDLPVFEVRNAEGYGLRWLADGSQFRGFLEPQMIDGHDKGWIH